MFVAALLGIVTPVAIATPALAQISIGISVRIAPPPLPVYAQPPLPGPDYIWTPGYWAWDDYVDAYFWVPGTWVRAPRPGLLWTPPWWGWSDGLFLFHTGYWGPHVGFYGGVPYGFGYTGLGFQGGYWNGGHVFYNSSVTNVTNVHVTNVYRNEVVVNRTTNVSYNGGPGGVQARPSAQEQMAAHEERVAPTGNQQAHIAAAHADPRAFASANHGRPPMLATARPIMAAPGGTPGAQRFAARPPAPEPERGVAPHVGNPPSTEPGTPRAALDARQGYVDSPYRQSERQAPGAADAQLRDAGGGSGFDRTPPRERREGVAPLPRPAPRPPHAAPPPRPAPRPKPPHPHPHPPAQHPHRDEHH